MRNHYKSLTNETNEDNNVEEIAIKIHVPPSIFIHGVINYAEMIKTLQKASRNI